MRISPLMLAQCITAGQTVGQSMLQRSALNFGQKPSQLPVSATWVLAHQEAVGRYGGCAIHMPLTIRGAKYAPYQPMEAHSKNKRRL